MNDMRKARVVQGAIIEGDPDDDNTDGNAGEWIPMVLMLEEVRPCSGKPLLVMGCWISLRSLSRGCDYGMWQE